MRKEVPKPCVNVIDGIYEGSCISAKNICGVTMDFRKRTYSLVHI